ncbi:vacuolar protein sorting-associated protein 41 [Histomonas meleagridis]|uniref:vacuolar protein sorting-associated protein 41-like n=1 Tax=Histomonas meleagridis TaxID=135588 RepID=UPI003559EB62|nr:vacuolar protein sorting-associated protein 41 [Histomonas meleagridis]KAH0805614.1 vacuolar protein sorting-associated protein 41-like [Histomonas meleagridis]
MENPITSTDEQDPMLKYTKLELSFPPKPTNRKINQDPNEQPQISAFASCNKYFACGLYDGRVFVFRHGESVPVYNIFQNQRTCSLCFDPTGDILLASFYGGTLIAQDYSAPSIKEYTYNHKCSIPSSISPCAIDPDFKQCSDISCIYYSANENVIIRLKPGISFLRHAGHSDPIELARGVSNVTAISWKGDFIVWTSKDSITVYRASRNEKIFNINTANPKNQPRNSNINYLHDSILFNTNDSLTVLYKSDIFTVQISSKQYHVKHTNEIILDMTKTPSLTAKLLELSKLTIQVDNKGTILNEAIPEKTDLTKYFCICPNRNDLYFANSTSVFSVTRFTDSERILFYLDQRKMDTCLKQFESIKDSLPSDEKLNLLFKIIQVLFELNQPERATEICKTLKTDQEWGKMIIFFRQLDKLHYIAPIVPLDKLNLDPSVTTEILIIIAKNEKPEVFCQIFDNLTPDKYIASSLMYTVTEKSEEHTEFNIPKMKLQHLLQEHSKAFTTALSIGYKDFFKDIQTYNQYSYLKEHFGEILKVYPEFPNFLMEHLDQCPPLEILKQVKVELNNTKRITDKQKSKQQMELIDNFKMNYLDNLYEIKSPILLQNEQIGTELALMYIKCKSNKTLNYLKTTGNFNVLAVFEAAKEQGMYQEAAYLCKLSGDRVQGMKIHLQYLDDPISTIEYAKDCDDNEVYKLLIEHSYKNPKYMECMLEDLSNLNINPVRYIEGIPDVKMINNFEKLAAKSVKEYKRKLSTAQLSQEIVSKDAFGAFKRSFNNYIMGKKTHF